MNIPMIMCQLCFEMFYKEQLASIIREREFDYEDVCVRCKGVEHLTEMRLWGI
jgi:hypothetical protein